MPACVFLVTVIVIFFFFYSLLFINFHTNFLVGYSTTLIFSPSPYTKTLPRKTKNFIYCYYFITVPRFVYYYTERSLSQIYLLFYCTLVIVVFDCNMFCFLNYFDISWYFYEYYVFVSVTRCFLLFDYWFSIAFILF